MNTKTQFASASAECRVQSAECRVQRAEGRGQRAEGRGQRAEGRGERLFDLLLHLDNDLLRLHSKVLVFSQKKGARARVGVLTCHYHCLAITQSHTLSCAHTHMHTHQVAVSNCHPWPHVGLYSEQHRLQHCTNRRPLLT